jgi:hypothetical protein
MVAARRLPIGDGSAMRCGPQGKLKAESDERD